MGLNLPKDGYEAMVLINQLSNNGGIAGIGYQTIKKNGQVHLIGIRAKLKKPLLIDNPEVIGQSGSLIQLPGNMN